MQDDVKCPYCGQEQEICHDDGYGYEEDEHHEQECVSCEKTFIFMTTISFYYQAFKADCLNGGDHEYKPTITYPVEATRMRCVNCGIERPANEEELAEAKERRG